MELNALKEFYKEPLTGLCGALCKSIGIEPPTEAKGCANDLVDYVMKETAGKGVDKIVMYNPDAIGAWIYETYYEKFKSFRDNAA